jgi:predicted TIM-barrel fold metal-dependent hydrolase
MPAYRIVDPHQHNGQWSLPGRFGSIELNLYYMKRYHISAAIISSTEAIVSDMVDGNARLAGYIAGKPGVFGYVVVNPHHLRLSCQEMDKHYASRQFVGAKLHPSYVDLPLASPKTASLIKEIAARGKPTLIHTWGASEVAALVKYAQRWPQWRVLMAHSGGPAWREGIAAAADTPNIYLEFCTSLLDRGKIERAVEALGPERVLFGSDTSLFEPGYMLAAYAEANLPPEAAAMVMGENAIKLFDLEL